MIEAFKNTTLISLLSRVLGLIKSISIIAIFGFSLETDTFFLALAFSEVIIIFSDVFESVGVPNLVRAHLDNDARFRLVSKDLLTFTIVVSSLLTIFFYSIFFLIIFSFHFISEIQRNELILFLLVLLPYILLMFYFQHFGAILKSKRFFTTYFIGELIFAFISLLIVIIGSLYVHHGILLPISLVIGEFFAVLFLCYNCKNDLSPNPNLIRAIAPYMKEFMALSIAYTSFALSLIINRIFATLLPVKHITALMYGWIYATTPRNIFRVENILITFFSETNANLKKSMQCILWVFLGAALISLILFIASDALIRLLFFHGNVIHFDIELTASFARFYLIGIPFLFIWSLSFRILQIWKKYVLIIFIAILGLVCTISLNFILFFIYSLGALALPIATSLSNICLAVLSVFVILSYQVNKKEQMRHV